MDEYPVTISLVVNGVAGGQVGTLTTTVEMPEADGERLLAYILGVFGTDPEGTPRTPQQAIEAFAAGFWDDTALKALRWQREQAARAAAEAVPALEYRQKAAGLP